MTTPTPMKHGLSQQGRTPNNALGTAPTPRTIAAATPPVSTPFSQMHAVFSPPGGPHGPRSSPQYFKKSPANSTTLLGHPGGGPANYDSPSAAAAFGSLSVGELGLDATSTPNTSALQAAAFGSAIQRTDEDERLRRLVKVMEILEPFKGRVSEHALDRLAGRTGLDVMWENTITNGMATRTLMIAGKAVAIDIVCANNLVLDVTLSFPNAPLLVNKHGEKANKILLSNLKLAAGQSPLTKTLDSFAANLERLAALDKLCIVPGLNCHEAIAGIYESLARLFRWDIEQILSGPSRRTPELAEMDALSTRHGRPLMHARSKVGMSLDYWKKRWMVPRAGFVNPEDDGDSIFTLLIGCTKANSRMSAQGIVFPPVRVSENWIAEPFEKLNPTPEEALLSAGPILDWHEPEMTVLPDTNNTKEHDMGTDALVGAGNRLPDVIFTASLDPPLNIPLHDYQGLCNLVEEVYQQPSAYDLYDKIYDNLIFPIPPGSNHEPSQPRKLCEVKQFPTYSKDGSKQMVTQKHTCYINKRIYGHTLRELPFSHPKQLVAILPVLRQYAMLTTLLEASFCPGNDSWKDTKASGPSTVGFAAGKDSAQGNGKEHYPRETIISVGEDFNSFMDRDDSFRDGDMQAEETKSDVQAIANLSLQEKKASCKEDNEDEIAVDMALFIHPVPSIKVNFPFARRQHSGETFTADVLIEIGPHGMVTIASQNIVPEGSEAHDRIRKALQVLCDLGIWVNWVRSNI